MAESAAHLTTNLSNKPSIFEVVASDSLLSTFYPAFKRIANVSISLIALPRPSNTITLSALLVPCPAKPREIHVPGKVLRWNLFSMQCTHPESLFEEPRWGTGRFVALQHCTHTSLHSRRLLIRGILRPDTPGDSLKHLHAPRTSMVPLRPRPLPLHSREDRQPDRPVRGGAADRAQCGQPGDQTDTHQSTQIPNCLLRVLETHSIPPLSDETHLQSRTHPPADRHVPELRRRGISAAVELERTVPRQDKGGNVLQRPRIKRPRVLGLLPAVPPVVEYGGWDVGLYPLARPRGAAIGRGQRYIPRDLPHLPAEVEHPHCLFLIWVSGLLCLWSYLQIVVLTRISLSLSLGFLGTSTVTSAFWRRRRSRASVQLVITRSQSTI